MKSRQFCVPALIIILGVACAGVVSCSKSSNPAAEKGGGGLSLIGAGATFPYPIYSKWVDEYHKSHPDVAINYQSIGSGGGIRQVLAGTVDFGASDGPMTDEQIQQFQRQRGCDVLHFPTVLGADVPSYNLPGIQAELNFTPEALAAIFMGTVNKWNDPLLTKANPGINLPSDNIVVVHRSDGSGTTYVWTDYLSKISEEWRSKVGKGTSVNWPVGLGGKGNEGVSGLISLTPDSIGYIELIYAVQNHLAYGRVRNSSGNFIKADLNSVTVAAAEAAQSMPEDFRVSLTDAPGKEAYPVSSFTWLLVPSRIQDPQKKQAIVDFLRWMLADGQNLVEALAYARLPQQVVAKETQAISRVQ
jgi:phosphate transport system substrate-binding protein